MWLSAKTLTSKYLLNEHIVYALKMAKVTLESVLKVSSKAENTQTYVIQQLQFFHCRDSYTFISRNTWNFDKLTNVCLGRCYEALLYSSGMN